jgi:hypothetical protein
MRSTDLQDKDWTILNEFIKRCEDEFEGETVWGQKQ